MDDIEVLARARVILGEAGIDEPATPTEFFFIVADVVKEWPRKRQENTPWLLDWAEGIRRLSGEWSKLVERDPMLQYRPAHEVSLAFHMSLAKVRYNRSANRTSKSQAGYAEHYFVLTGQHPWRLFNPPPAKSFIVGVDYQKYAVEVFAAKMVDGETGNPLAPMFPEDGKWFNHFDRRKHRLRISCKACAEAGRNKDCKHTSSVSLFSDAGSETVLMGGQYNLGHFDEHISEKFFDEAMERLKTVRNSSMIITGTPLLGKSSWEYKRLERLHKRGPKYNRWPGSTNPYVTI